MSFCCAEPRAGRQRRPLSSPVLVRIVATCAAYALVLAVCLPLPAAAAGGAGLPVDDNELIVGGGVGPLVVEQVDAVDRADVTVRIGLAMELFVGFMRRATSWLDIELAAGFSALWLGEDGFAQRAPTGAHARNFLPGAHLRADLRALLSDDGLGVSALLGLAAAFFAAPASGSFAQVGLELGLGLDILRDADTHLGLDVVYHLALVDELPDEPGVPLLDPTHRVVVRIGYGF